MASKILLNIGSGIGLLIIRHQAFTWPNSDLLWMGPLGLNINEI